MKKVLLAFLICSTSFCFSQSLNVIPQPAKAEIKQGTFTITPSTKIVFSASNVEKSAEFFNSYLKKYYGFELKTTKTNESKNVIELNYDRVDNSIPGGYQMKVDNNKVYIGGNDEQGVFYGIQTLIQLLPTQKSN